MHQSKRTGFVLVELVVVLAIVVILAGAYFGLRGKSKSQPAQQRFPGEAQTIPGRAIQKGQSVDCMNDLRQIRSAIQMYQGDNGVFPQALDSSWGVPLQCPVSTYAYQYTPQTGQVKCVTPGHENY